MIVPEDDFFHDREDPMWGDWDRTGWFNESGWFGYAIPERDISGLFYVHHRTNYNVMWAGTALWDATGHRRQNSLHQDWRLWPRPEGANVFDFVLPNSLTFTTIDPMQKYGFSFSSKDFEADLTWTAFTEPQDDRGIPKEWAQWCPKHYEQFGKMKGTIKIEGELLEVDCYSARDRSFGPHRMTEMGRGNFPWAIASEQHGFFAYIVSDLDPATDPMFETSERVRGGWYLRDGEIATLVDGQRRVKRADNTRPLYEIIDAVDDRGREFHAEGEVRNSLFFDGFPDNWWYWGAVNWTINGEPAIGETQDNAPREMWS
ncbi:MAG: hypothetical protein ACRDV9_11470, partial [Acidimicrobiia bacterium]